MTNPDINMRQNCASKYAITKTREKAGFVAGTQVTKNANVSETSDKASGIRGVYHDRKTGKYRARLKFQGKLYNLGSFVRLKDAVKARKHGQEEILGAFLTSYKNA